MIHKKLALILFALLFSFAIASCTSGGKDDSTGDDITADGSDADLDAALGDEEESAEEADSEDFDVAEEEGGDEDFSDEPIDEEGDLEEELQAAEEPIQEPVEEPTQDEFAGAPMEEEPAQDTGFGPEVVGGADVQISDIKYLSNQSGGTVVINTTGQPQFKTRSNPATNQFIVEINNAELPERLKRPFVMKEFENSNFAMIQAYQTPGSGTARIIVQMKSATIPSVTADGGSIILLPSNVPMSSAANQTNETLPDATDYLEQQAQQQQQPQPMPVAAAGPTAAPRSDAITVQYSQQEEKILGARTLGEFLTGNNKFYGKRISIQVKDADIQDVIEFISDESGTNIIVSDEVDGKVTMKLRSVPWDQALVILLRSKNLGYLRQGNVLRISSLATLRKDTQEAKAVIEAQKQIDPVRVKVFPISYAKVEDLVKQVEPFLTTGRGKAVPDKRTSALIITDTDEVIRKLTRLIKELDIAPAQVMIEGKIVEAQESFQKSVGINWQYGGSPVEISESGGLDGSPLNLTNSFSINPVSAESLAGSTGSFNLNIGVLEFFGDIQATFALAESNQLVKILSSPRIVTINKEEAQISQTGEIISISAIADAGGQTTRQVNRTPVELNLKVTPQITAEGSVLMEVDVTREFPGPVVEQETLARAKNTRKAKTKVLVDNGHTAVIGGIYQSDVTESETGVPGLKNIPVIGWLFKGKNNDKNKNELLIFLTPRILNLQAQGVSNDGNG
jgi:type IV pilus assembly protein PilQ